MDNPYSLPEKPTGLQFTTSEPAETTSSPGGMVCVACNQSIQDAYFALGNQILCLACKEKVTAPPTGSGFVRFLKAVLFGTVAGLFGASIWYAIRVVAGIEVGLVAILVGFLVGKAVHVASGRRGGVGYQILAVFLTYCCIAANYAPDVYNSLLDLETERADAPKSSVSDKLAVQMPNGNSNDGNSNDTIPEVATEQPNADTIEPASNGASEAGIANEVDGENAGEKLPFPLRLVLLVIFIFVFSFAVPVMICKDSPIMILIIGFALWEAWKFSARHPLPITGPYQADTNSIPPVATA